MLPKEGTLEIKTLEKMLRLTKKLEKTRLEIALKALNKLGIIHRNTDDLVQAGNLEDTITATIRCSSKGYSFAMRDDGEEDIYIREKYLNQAWHGDKVLVSINREGVKRRSPEGLVICILERSKTNLLGTLTQYKETLLAKPLDERILAKVLLPQTDIKYFTDKQSNSIVDIKIIKYPIAQNQAMGQISRKLSLNEGLSGDIEILKTKYNLLNDTSSPKVAPKKTLQKQRINLEDQNSLLLKSWKLDDSPILPALYSEPYDGGFKIWLHVPTISERLSLGSKLDDWIKDRSNSICLATKWKNILNKGLITESGFNINESNDAITLEFNISKTGECKSWKFYLSTIKPKALVTQEHLEIIQKRSPKSKTIPLKLKPLKENLSIIHNLLYSVKLIDQQLIQLGVIHLEQDQPKIDILDDLRFPIPGGKLNGWIPVLDLTDPQSILNVFCKYSNIILYEHLSSYKLDFICLAKAESLQIQVNDIVKSALVLDTSINVNDEGYIKFSDLLSAVKESPNKRVIEKIIKNNLPDYKYYESTSPVLIQEDSNSTRLADNEDLPSNLEAPWSNPGINYADIVNQHILIKLLVDGKSKIIKNSKGLPSLGEKPISKSLDWNVFSPSVKSNIQKICSQALVGNLNSKITQASQFREGLFSLLQLRYIEKDIGKVVEGIITGVQSYGFFVEIQPALVEGLVHVSTLDDDWYEYRSRQNLLVGRKYKKTFQIGDPIKVKIQKVDILRNQIDLDVNDFDKIDDKTIQQEQEIE
ncbi:3'-to-5' exoribonuclease RNase R [Prochlorococcus sp. MIT 0602]|nr:3'-to-5' exoribonuclease RNase R [Prochlorococcus sp. MIT 0602]KGG17586.1 3'-to-5' exoribonuclease RNase R [Prochlorococcus sp. MIT 0603]